MKIPETSVNVGAYYGNEENGQWQPNGMIIDNGVGGGIVGSGDAGIHRGPIYPVHIPRGQIPGYVVTGAYYPAAGYPHVPQQQPDDFSDYMWMEHEEEFDKQVMQQLEEEALMEQCIEAMLDDEQRERNNRPIANGHKHNPHYPTTSNGGPSVSLEEAVSKSTLNPLAAEFYPTRVRPPQQPPHTADRQDHGPPTEEAQVWREDQSQPPKPITEGNVDSKPHGVTEELKDFEPSPHEQDPPEVSAADVQPICEKQVVPVLDKRPLAAPKDVKKEMAQMKPRIDNRVKVTKTEVKKMKPQPAKSETIVQLKRDVKAVRSEAKVEVKVIDKVQENEKVKESEVRCETKADKEIGPVIVAETLKVQPSQLEEHPQINTGFKPINYAAAAKANKPKKPSPPPSSLPQAPVLTAAERNSASATKTTKVTADSRKDKRTDKVSIKDKPIIPRKNSVK